MSSCVLESESILACCYKHLIVKFWCILFRATVLCDGIHFKGGTRNTSILFAYITCKYHVKEKMKQIFMLSKDESARRLLKKIVAHFLTEQRTSIYWRRVGLLAKIIWSFNRGLKSHGFILVGNDFLCYIELKCTDLWDRKLLIVFKNKHFC